MAYKVEELRDVQAESGVIATLIYHPEFIVHSEHLSSKYFTDMTLRILYWAIGELYKKGITHIDEVNLMTQINSNNNAKERFSENGLKTISDILQYAGCVARDTVEEYKMLANRIVELAFKRELYFKLQFMQGLCLDEKITLGELYREVNDGLSELSNKYLIGVDDIPLFGDKIDIIWERICSRRNPDGSYGFQWKFPTLNHYCPIEKGELIVIAGQEKKGKSTVMLNQLVYSIKSNIPCLYIDTELQEEGFLVRLLSCLTQIPAYKIKSGSYTASEEQMLEETKQYLKTVPFVYKYLPDANLYATYSLCRTLQYKIDLQLVFFDYIKDIESRDTSSQYNRLGHMTNFLKNEIAGSLDLAVVAGAQLNRNEEIADSIKIARYASTIIKVAFKDEKRIAQDGEECGNYMLWVDINRNGDWHKFDDGEYIDMLFKGDIYTVEETAKQHQVSLPF